VRPHEALDIANVIFNVVTYCPMNMITRLPSDILTDFFSYLSQITCEFCRASADENVCCYKMLCILVFLAFFDRLIFRLVWLVFVSFYSNAS